MFECELLVILIVVHARVHKLNSHMDFNGNAVASMHTSPTLACARSTGKSDSFWSVS